MRGECRGQLLPLAHEPRHLLLGALALRGDRAHALAVGVEGRIAQPFADLGQPRLERVDLALHVFQAPPQLAYVLGDLSGAPRRLRTRASRGRLRSSRRRRHRLRSGCGSGARSGDGTRLGVEVVVVATEIGDERTAGDLDDPGRDEIVEVAVVGDEVYPAGA